MYIVPREWKQLMVFSILALLIYACSDSTTTKPSNPDLGIHTSQVVLSWSKPLKREDGSDLSNLAGYYLRYGTESGRYTELVRIGADKTSHILEDLIPGTYYFVISSYDTNNLESTRTRELTALIQ